MPRLTSHHVCAAAFLLLVGPATTVGVAWGFSIWHRTINHYAWQFRDLGPVQEWSIVGAQFYTSGNANNLRALLNQSTELTDSAASWLPSAIPEADPHEDGWTWVFDARGWPMLALSCAYSYDGTSARLHHAVRSPLPSRARGDLGLIPWPVGLPMRPIWPGFAANSVFWAAAWCAIIAIPQSTRRALRRRRGQCPACAYDLRATPAGSLCPECGCIPAHRTTPVPPL